MLAPSYVFTIARVAKLLGELEELLREIAMDMEPEDSCLPILDLDDLEPICGTRVLPIIRSGPAPAAHPCVRKGRRP
jgi:hypothetical protein